MWLALKRTVCLGSEKSNLLWNMTHILRDNTSRSVIPSLVLIFIWNIWILQLAFLLSRTATVYVWCPPCCWRPEANLSPLDARSAIPLHTRRKSRSFSSFVRVVCRVVRRLFLVGCHWAGIAETSRVFHKFLKPSEVVPRFVYMIVRFWADNQRRITEVGFDATMTTGSYASPVLFASIWTIFLVQILFVNKIDAAMKWYNLCYRICDGWRYSLATKDS